MMRGLGQELGIPVEVSLPVVGWLGVACPRAAMGCPLGGGWDARPHAPGREPGTPIEVGGCGAQVLMCLTAWADGV